MSWNVRCSDMNKEVQAEGLQSALACTLRSPQGVVQGREQISRQMLQASSSRSWLILCGHSGTNSKSAPGQGMHSIHALTASNSPGRRNCRLGRCRAGVLRLLHLLHVLLLVLLVMLLPIVLLKLDALAGSVAGLRRDLDA